MYSFLVVIQLSHCFRELAFQISEQIEALGGGIGVRSAVIVGGVDMMQQALVLARKPHVVIGTYYIVHDYQLSGP